MGSKKSDTTAVKEKSVEGGVMETLQERIERAKQEMESEERGKRGATQDVSPVQKTAPSRRRSSGSCKDLPSPKRKVMGPSLPPQTATSAGEEGQGGEGTRDMVRVRGWGWGWGVLTSDQPVHTCRTFKRKRRTLSLGYPQRVSLLARLCGSQLRVVVVLICD